MFRAEILKKWELEKNPFSRLAPKNSEIRQKVFTGRVKELKKLIRYCKQTNMGTYLSGIYGSGKTMLCYELQRLLEEERIKSVYCSYNSEYGFMKTLLLGVANSLEEKLGKIIQALYRGMAINKQLLEQTNIGDTFYQFIMAQIEASESESTTINITVPYLWLKRLLEDYKDKHIVFIIEDMDRVKMYPEDSINDIIMMVRDLLREFDSTVLITGHPIGLIRDFGSHSDILEPIHLKFLSAECYREMCKKYLNSVREESSQYYNTYYPFTKDLVEWLSEKFNDFTPRLFNLACFNILEKAFDEEVNIIDKELGKKYLSESYIKIFSSLKEKDKIFLKAVYDAGGIFNEDDRELIKKITNDDFASIMQVISKTIDIEDTGLLSRQTTSDGDFQVIAPGYEILKKFREYVKSYIPEEEEDEEPITDTEK